MARRSAAPLVAQVGIAALAGLAFFWLANVLYGRSQPAAFADGLVKSLSAPAWIALCLIGLVVLLLLEIILLRPVYKAERIAAEPAWAAQAALVAAPAGPHSADSEPTVEFEPIAAFSSRSGRLRVGCAGCGTVLDVALGLSPLVACPHCGRSGAVVEPATAALVTAADCITCGQPFEQYLDDAECPRCHSPNHREGAQTWEPVPAVPAAPAAAW